MRSLGVIAALFVALALGAVSTVSAHDDDDDDAEVRVAQVANGKCGKLTDSLPALISRTGLRPGEVAGDVTVCVENRGDDAALSLRVIELVDVDRACTGEEPTRDSSCGSGKRGELGASLLQQVRLGACPSVPSGTNPALDRRLPNLQSSLGLVARLRRKQIVCVRLRLLYEPPNSNASITSQSDRVTWRYAFTLTERD